jgi:hypothetical protein
MQAALLLHFMKGEAAPTPPVDRETSLLQLRRVNANQELTAEGG